MIYIYIFIYLIKQNLSNASGHPVTRMNFAQA